MGGMIGTIITQVLLAVIQWLASRKDLRDSVKREMLLNAANQVKAALEWKASHPVDTTTSITNDFGVRESDSSPSAKSSRPTTPST